MADPLQLKQLRAAIATAERHRRCSPGDPAADEEVRAARAKYAEAKLADYIRAVVDSAPQLTDAQRARLAALLSEPDAEPAA